MVSNLFSAPQINYTVSNTFAGDCRGLKLYILTIFHEAIKIINDNQQKRIANKLDER